MTRLAVVAFPELGERTTIESLRERYDPHAGLLSAHVTLVFPFVDTTDELRLRRHLERAVADVGPFDIVLPSVSLERDGYVFLDIGDGAAGCVALHDRLYTGPLARHLSSELRYRPHITVGRIHDAALTGAARDEIERHLQLPARGTMRSLSLFRLHDAGRGDVAFTIPLPTARSDVGGLASAQRAVSPTNVEP